MSIYKWLSKLRVRPHRKPLAFPSSGFDMFDERAVLEEERFEEYRRGKYYPMRLGEVLTDRFQVAGKLGYGTTSTVWLAQDMQARKHVALKVYTRDVDHNSELEVYQHIRRAAGKHPGSQHVRSMVDVLRLPRDGGDHHCLVQEPLWESLLDLRHRRDPPQLSEDLLKPTLVQVFQALDFLHTECNLVHTDLKDRKIFLAIADRSILDQFVKDELEHPCPRKFLTHAIIYASRPFDVPSNFGQVVVGDLGEAVNGEQPRHHNAQPNLHRSPEVMLKAGWSYAVDVWNVGTMVWDLFEGKHLYSGRTADGSTYTTSAHLAEIIVMFGLPPRDFLERGRRVDEFFDSDGQFIADGSISGPILEASEERLKGGISHVHVKDAAVAA